MAMTHGLRSELGDRLDDLPRPIERLRTRSDRVYRGLALGGGLATLVVLFLIGLFLLLRSVPAFKVAGWSFFTRFEWNPDGTTHRFGIAAIMYGTIEIATIALVIAVPVSIVVGLFLTEYAPRRLQAPLRSLVDLLAAVPSLIYGIWGFFFLQPHLVGVARFLSDHVGFIPIFKTTQANFASSPFMAGTVVSLMVIPI